KSGKIPLPELGTLLFTGEAQRAVNCLSLADELTSLWPGLMAAQLNPSLESTLSAYGAHAVQLSSNRLGTPILHIDVGGGTSNLAWIENGKIIDTSCLDLGARKWVVDPSSGKVLVRTRGGERLEKWYPEIIKSGAFDVTTATRFAEKIAELIL